MAEPAAKKQKTEEGAVTTAEVEEKKEAPKVPEPPKELEEDAPKASGATVKEAVAFLTADTTMNVMVSMGNNLLMPLSDGGVRHLLAGARANVGLKSGRYMFEAKIVEVISRADEGNQPQPKSLLRIGFSTAGSSLLMGSEETDICFESDGVVVHNRKRSPLGKAAKFGRDSVVAVLLNLDKSSPNTNTISLFKDGKRVCQPQALPESLQGKTLYPTFTYRNFSVSVNFGPAPLTPLPFTCTMVGQAAVKDSAVSTATAPKDGKYEVLFPVCLPDEGGFDWLDAFKAKSPQYTELSDRAIAEWAFKSGISFPRSTTSNDKPDIKSGIPEVDDMSIRRSLQSIAPLQPRNYIVMEVQSNLIKEKRAISMGRFLDGTYKKVACVVVGDPSTEFKKHTQALILKEKQTKSDKQFRLQKAAEAQKRAAEKRQKEMENNKKKAEKERKRKLAEIQKAAAKAKYEAEKKKAEEEGKDPPPEPEEEKAEEPEEEEEEEVAEEPVAMDEDPPEVELTDEEKKVVFRTLPMPDMALYELNTSFAKFSAPEKDEGFDDIKYEWAKASKAAEHVKKWVLDRKQTSRVEDLVPSPWFKAKWAAWQKTLNTWHKKQGDYKASLAKKAAEKKQKAAKKEAAAKAAAAKAAAEAAKKEKAKEEGKEEEAKDEEVKEDEKPEAMEEDEPEEEEVVVDFEGVDIFGTAEVDDIGGGMPLYKDFANEDWALMALSFELQLLVHAFKKDCNDPERGGIILEHLGFYYNKYYGKVLSAKAFGVDAEEALVGLAKDAVFLNKDKALDTLLDDEMEYPQVFVKIAEDGRRHRALMVDMGDDSAKLKIAASLAPAANAPVKGAMKPKGGDKGFSKGGDKGFSKGSDKGFSKGGDKGFSKGGDKGFSKGGDKGFSKGGGKAWNGPALGKGGPVPGKGGPAPGKGGPSPGKGGHAMRKGVKGFGKNWKGGK